MNHILSVLFMAFLLLIVGIFVGKLLLATQKKPSSASVQRISPRISGTNISDSTESPKTVTQNFYDWYMNCKKDNTVPCAYDTYPFVSIALVETIQEQINGSKDPILCSQTIPQNLTIDKVTNTSHTTAQVIIETQNPAKALAKVDLELRKNQWNITNITCAT